MLCFDKIVFLFLSRGKEKGMLVYLRANTGNWIIKFFLAIIIIVFVFLGVGSIGSKRKNSIATIDGEPVSIKEYQRTYNRMIEQYKIQFGNNLTDELLKALKLKEQALHALVNSKLLLRKADELGVIVSAKELQDNLMSEKAFQVDGKFNLEHYKRVLSLNRLTPEIYEQSQRDELKRQKVRQMVLSAITVSDLEARDWYTYQNKKIAVDYIKFSPGAIKIQPDAQQILTYYEQNKSKYQSSPKVKAAYLKFSPQDYKGKTSVSEEAIKVYYQDNLKRYEIAEKVEARHILIKVDKDSDEKQIAQGLKKAQDIYKKAVGGEDFATLAKTYSEGPSNKNGGYLGSFEKTAMVKPFADQAFSMKPGEISKPVLTQFGWHIIKVISRSGKTEKTLAQVHDQIKNELEQEQMQNRAYEMADEAFEAVIDGDDFEQVARIADKKSVQTMPFSIQGQELTFPGKKEFAKAAFGLNLNDISDVLQFGNDYYLIQVVEKIEPVDLPLEKVKKQVTAHLTGKLQKESARKQAKTILDTIKSDTSLKDVAELNHLTLQTTRLFARNDSVNEVGKNVEFLKAGFSLDKPGQIHRGIIETPVGYFIVSLNKIELPKKSEIEKNLKNVKQEIRWQKQSRSMQAWLAELKKQHDIVYDAGFLN